MEKFSDIQGLEFDRMKNVVRILRKEFKTEVRNIMFNFSMALFL